MKINSDGNWISVPKNQGIYNLHDLKKYCKKKGEDIDITEISKKGYCEQIYDYILPTLKPKPQDKLERLLAVRSRWEDERVYDMLLNTERYGEPSSFSEFYIEQIRKNGSPFLRKNIVDWHYVYGYFYSTGHYLSPVGTSEQDGDHKAVKSVLECALQIINKDMEGMEMYDEEEEDAEV